MAIDYTSIGKRIKRYRTDRGLSQEELAARVGTTHKHISNMETAVKVPSLDMLILLSNALEVSADDLLTDSLTHSTSTSGTEIHALLLDCNEDETKMLTRTLKFLKALLTEFGV